MQGELGLGRWIEIDPARAEPAGMSGCKVMSSPDCKARLRLSGGLLLPWRKAASPGFYKAMSVHA